MSASALLEIASRFLRQGAAVTTPASWQAAAVALATGRPCPSRGPIDPAWLIMNGAFAGGR